MSEGFICRNSGDGYATINFNTYTGVVHGSLTSSSKVLTEGRASLEATSVGDYVLFGGGLNSTEYSSTVEHYTVDNIFQVFPETKYKFSGMSSEQTSSSIKTVTVKPPISGYIKVKNINIS